MLYNFILQVGRLLAVDREIIHFQHVYMNIYCSLDIRQIKGDIIKILARDRLVYLNFVYHRIVRIRDKCVTSKRVFIRQEISKRVQCITMKNCTILYFR